MPIPVTTGGPISPGGTPISPALGTSAILDYASLLIDVSEYSQNPNLAHVYPRLVGLAEAKLNRVLRTADMETLGTVTLTTGSGDLPDDFLEMIQIIGPNSYLVNAVSQQELYTRFKNYGGTPAGYSISGSKITLRPTTDGEAAILYYGRIPPLSPAIATNWLLLKAPDVYLYAVLEEAAIMMRDPEMAMRVSAMKDQAIQGLRINDERSRWSNSRVVVRGINP